MNIVSQAVLLLKLLKLLQHQRMGGKLYQSFINKDLIGSDSVWSPLKRYKLPTFKSQRKKITVQHQFSLLEVVVNNRNMKHET